ncbi:MAG: glycosyltransferase family 2 protein [Actinobacteria bacterium]|nr:glycosyltransferase family 2 protein [Actinomycetota bacterium]
MIILIILLINFLINQHLFKEISFFKLTNETKDDLPLVSVLIPARNEEKNIERCIRSFLKQDYSNFEIVVLDDNSSDKTFNIVKKISVKNKNIKVFKGKQLPQGWLGKNFACHQLSRLAKGDYFIFTDADTYHLPNSISSSIAALLNNNLDALSPFPRQIMITIHERMALTFINFAILIFMPLALIKKSKNPLFCTGVGQYLLFKREAYFGMGGHSAVKGKILEDVHITKKTKEMGYKYMIFDGRKIVSCRMYRNFKQVLTGYTRFLFSAFDYNIFMMSTVLILVTMIFLLPYILLPLGLIVYHWSYQILILLILQIFIISLIRLINALRFRERVTDIFLHPLTIIYLIFMAANSFFQNKFGSGIYWKGRIYHAESRSDELNVVEDEDISLKVKNH